MERNNKRLAEEMRGWTREGGRKRMREKGREREREREMKGPSASF